MSVSKTGVMETTTADVPVKQSFGARVGRHYKKWWWAHLIIFVIVFLVVALPVIYVAYPNIAQHDVSASTLTVDSMILSDPTPDGFHLSQVQTIGSHSTYHPKIYAFDAAVSLAGAASAFATVRVPTVKSKDGVKVDVSQDVDLSNTAAFGGFSTAIMLNEEIEMNIYGKPKLQQGSLPKVTVTYNKTVTMKGLNKLKGFDVVEFQILTNATTSRNMNGTVYIPNPSVLTLYMGNVTLNLAVNGTTMGQTYLENLVLKPGNNTVPMSATVQELQIANALILGGDTYKDGVMPFQITGNSSVYNGKELPYFTEALKSNNLTVNLNVTEALSNAGIKL
ncbi:hypothetical protein N7478_009311 [Penicillium angulare]|uniref:uncharacterized protein n=1 Tax=Penicillium angulare TaxID=116970 RepID=UPI0025424E30|nr:uncharacterized protein N7478_009311 [Penicillium angulare]KAJ5266503.1 hypothetical protein N7478_009311 [Penicillium angulare]